MNDPLVSIVIPTHNSAQYVAAAIDSALAQQYPRCEVVVVDDGSSDNTIDVLAGYGGRIRVERLPQNRGAPAARNRGIGIARGKFIQLLDSDDVLFPNKIKVQMLVIARDPEVTPVCGYEIRRQDGLLETKRFICNTADALVFVLESHMLISSPIHRKDRLLAIGGFREDLPCAQERDLHLRLAAEGMRINCLPDILYQVQSRQGSVSSDFLKVLDQYEKILPPLYEKLAGKQQLDSLRRRAFARCMSVRAFNLAERSDFDKSARYFAIARSFDAKGWLEAFHPLIRPLAARHPIAATRITMRVGQFRRFLGA